MKIAMAVGAGVFLLWGLGSGCGRSGEGEGKAAPAPHFNPSAPIKSRRAKEEGHGKAAAGHAPAAGGHGAAPTPEEALEAAAGLLSEVIVDNQSWVGEHDAEFFAPFADHQSPRATVVGCSDSRFQIDSLDQSPDGDIFTIRNIGNQFENSLGSVDYGVRHLHTPLLMIVGHVKCGAVKAAMGDYSTLSRSIREELNPLAPNVQHYAGEEFDTKWAESVESNVHAQVKRAMEEFKAEVEAGTLIVVGGVYDFRDDLHQGQGRLVIIDVNGEESETDIDRTPIMSDQRVRMARKVAAEKAKEAARRAADEARRDAGPPAVERPSKVIPAAGTRRPRPPREPAPPASTQGRGSPP